MSSFDSDEEEDKERDLKKKIRLGRGGEEKRDVLFPKHPKRSERDEDAIVCFVKTLKLLCTGGTIDSGGDDIYLHVSCGGNAIIDINVADTIGPPPELERVKPMWYTCTSTYHITQRIKDYVESRKLNGDPNSCGQIMAELLMLGSQFSLTSNISVNLHEPRPQTKEFLTMSDSQVERTRVESALCRAIFDYRKDVVRIKKLLLSLVDMKRFQSDDYGDDWAVTITFERWMENWDSELRGFVPLFRRM